MEGRNEILDELRELKSPLADMSRAMPYAVPEGYFNKLAAELQANIGMELSTDPVADWGKTNPYTVPSGYFENILPEFWKRIEVTEPKLPLTKESPFIVPEGYFEQLPEQIIAKARAAEAKKETKVIPLRPRVGRAIRWAAAAMLVLGIGIGSYTMLQEKQPSLENQLASLPVNSVDDYIQQGVDDFDMEAIESSLVMNTEVDASQLKGNDLDKEEINEYLDEMGG